MSEEGRFEKFVAEATRSPRIDVHMRLACKELLATSQSELERFQHIIRAAQLMTDECKRQGFELDVALLNKLDGCVKSFMQAQKQKIEVQEGVYILQCIPWVFPQTKENFDVYIAEWWKVSFPCFPELLTQCREAWLQARCECGYVIFDVTVDDWLKDDFSEKSRKYGVVPSNPEQLYKCPVCGARWYGSYKPPAIRQYFRTVTEPVWRFFFDATSHALPPEGYNMLVGNFLHYYSGFVADIAGKVAKSISPEIFREVWQHVQVEGEGISESGVG